MKEKRLKKILSSIRGHIDSRHSQVVQEKKNIDTNLEKILKLTDADDHKDTNSLEHSNEAHELRPLIQDLYKEYQSLYGHYDHLIGKLKKKVHHDGESNGGVLSNSSSSDSDSSDAESKRFYSYTEKKTNKTGETELEQEKISVEDCQYLKAQLEKLEIRNAEMETEAKSMISKIKEGESLATKLAEREAAYFAIEDEFNRMRERNEVLQVENEALKQECNQQQVLSSQSLKCFEEEKEALLLEKSMALDRLAQADKYVEEFKVKIEQLEDELSKLQTENVSMKEQLENLEDELSSMKESNKDLQVENGDLKQELEKSNQLQALISQSNEALLLEKSMVLMKLEEADGYVEGSKIEAEQLKCEISKLQDESGVLKRALETKTQQVDDLNQKLASINEEKDALSSENFSLLGKVQVADEITRNLRDESELNLKLANERLSENAKWLSDNEKLKFELEAANQQVADLIQRLSTFEEDTIILRSEILKITTKMHDAEKFIEELRSECGLLRDEKSELLGINEDLNQQLRVKDDEKLSLSLKHNEAVINLKQIQEDMEMLSKELEISNAECSQMKVKYEGLHLEFEGASYELSDMRRMVQALEEEKSVIASDNSLLLSKAEEFEKMMDELKAEKQRLESDNSVLKNKLDDLVHKLESVEEEKNTLESEKLVMLCKLEQAEGSLKEILNEVEQLRRENCLFQQHQLDSQREISELGRCLEGKEGNISSLQKNLEEASSQIETVTINAGSLQQELDAARIKINELEEQVKVMANMASEKHILMEKLENELRSEVLTQETLLKEQKDNLDQLLEKYRLLDIQFQESSMKLEIADGKLAEMESKDETIRLLHTIDREQKLQISRLEENLIEMSEKLKFSESEKADLDKEITKLHGQVQTLEVQIRLSNQKLKITETENKEKEEGHKRTLVALQEERRRLEEHTSVLSVKVNLMEGELMGVKEVVKDKMEYLGREFNILDLKLEEHCRHIQTQMSGCTDDITMIKHWVNALIYAREGLKNEKRELTMRLNYKEGIISMLKDEAGVLGSKLATKAKEGERLVVKVTQLEKSMLELEKKVKEKEEELFSKDEEKREVIRQLCLLIEYHRENCNHLCKFLSATLKGGRRTTLNP